MYRRLVVHRKVGFANTEVVWELALHKILLKSVVRSPAETREREKSTAADEHILL